MNPTILPTLLRGEHNVLILARKANLLLNGRRSAKTFWNLINVMNTSSLALRCAAVSWLLAVGPGPLIGHPQSPEPPQSKASAFTANHGESASAGDTSKLGASLPPANPRGVAISTAQEEEYRIGAGDVLHISVWKEPEASLTSIVVRPDGKITLPLVKDVQVGGLTPKEADAIITSRLSAFITDPNVTVIVTGINSKKLYIIGAVKKEGPLAYTYKMTIMQALIEAGGLTDYAKRSKIYVLRAERGKETKIPFDYDAVLKGKDVDQVWLQPNDTLVVPH